MTRVLSTEKALELLANDHKKCLGIALGITLNEGRADDVVSESVLSAIEQIRAETASFENASLFFAWLHRIVRRTAVRSVNRPQGKNEPKGNYQSYDETIHTGNTRDYGSTAHDHARCWLRAKVPQGAAPEGYERPTNNY